MAIIYSDVSLQKIKCGKKKNLVFCYTDYFINTLPFNLTHRFWTIVF